LTARALILAGMFLASCNVASGGATPAPAAAVTPPPIASAVSFVPVSTPNPTPSPSPTSRIVTFRDPATGDSLAIELAANAVDRGHFGVTLDKDVYGGGSEVRATISSFSAPMQISYDGAMDLTEDGASAPRKTTVSLRGTIDPDAHAADIVFVADGKSYAIAARPPNSGPLAGVLDRMERALVADDALALYAITSQAVHDNYTAAQFVDAWQAQSAATGRRITAMRRQSIGPVVESDQGFATVEVRYSADVSDTSGSRVTGYICYLIFESGEWRLWTTTEN
jgi:hypothetical protein